MNRQKLIHGFARVDTSKRKTKCLIFFSSLNFQSRKRLVKDVCPSEKMVMPISSRAMQAQNQGCSHQWFASKSGGLLLVESCCQEWSRMASIKVDAKNTSRKSGGFATCSQQIKLRIKLRTDIRKTKCVDFFSPRCSRSPNHWERGSNSSLIMYPYLC